VYALASPEIRHDSVSISMISVAIANVSFQTTFFWLQAFAFFSAYFLAIRAITLNEESFTSFPSLCKPGPGKVGGDISRAAFFTAWPPGTIDEIVP